MDENPYKAPDEAGSPNNLRSDWRFFAIIFYWIPVAVLVVISIWLALASELAKPA